MVNHRKVQEFMKKPIAGKETMVADLYGRQVILQKFTLPNGKEDEFFLIKRKVGNNPIMVLPITTDGEVVAIRQFRFAVNDLILELPGGNIEPGQTEEQTVAQELLQETGYHCGKLWRLSSGFWIDAASIRVKMIPYLALDCVKKSAPRLESTEIIEVQLLTWKQWCSALLDQNTLIDAKSATVTLLSLPRLGLKFQP